MKIKAKSLAFTNPLFLGHPVDTEEAIGLQFIWDNRKSKQRNPYMRAELEAAISIRKRSRLQKLRETADIMKNMIENFLI